MIPDISERAFEAPSSARCCATGRTRVRTTRRRCGSLRRSSATTQPRRLPPAPAGRLRPRAAPDPHRRRRLPPGHPAEGVGEAEAAPRGRYQPRFLGRLSHEIARRGALDVLRKGVRTRVASSGLRTSGRRAGSTRNCSACTRPTCSRWCASFGSANGTNRASTSRSS